MVSFGKAMLPLPFPPTEQALNIAVLSCTFLVLSIKTLTLASLDVELLLLHGRFCPFLRLVSAILQMVKHIQP